MTMNKILGGWLAVVLLLYPVLGQTVDAEKGLGQILAAEKAMAKLFYEKGLREAYLTYMAEDAIAFRAGPCLARPLHEKQPADLPILFAWEPELADISLAGDLGYSFGPYHVYKNRSTQEPIGTGHYLSFWRKEADGTWKSIVDVGHAHGKVDLTVKQIRRPEKTGATGWSVKQNGNPDKLKSSLLQLDSDFTRTTKSKGITQAYMDIVAPDFHLCCEGEFPRIGKRLAAEVLQNIPGTMIWKIKAAVVAISGDLAFTYGTREQILEEDGKEICKLASYIRIWNRSPHRGWILFLDLSVPYPPPKDSGGR